MLVLRQDARLALSGKSTSRSLQNDQVVTAYSAGFYAENLLLYAPQAKEEGILPLPIGDKHRFAPVALGVRCSHLFIWMQS